MAVISGENAARASDSKLRSAGAFSSLPEMSSRVTFLLLAPPQANKHQSCGALSSLRRGSIPAHRGGGLDYTLIKDGGAEGRHLKGRATPAL